MGSEEAPMTWTLDGTEIRNHEGHKLASARYGPIKPCSMQVSTEEQQEALQLMVKAPEMWLLLHACLRWFTEDPPPRIGVDIAQDIRELLGGQHRVPCLGCGGAVPWNQGSDYCSGCIKADQP